MSFGYWVMSQSGVLCYLAGDAGLYVLARLQEFGDSSTYARPSRLRALLDLPNSAGNGAFEAASQSHMVYKQIIRVLVPVARWLLWPSSRRGFVVTNANADAAGSVRALEVITFSSMDKVGASLCSCGLRRRNLATRCKRERRLCAATPDHPVPSIPGPSQNVDCTVVYCTVPDLMPERESISRPAAAGSCVRVKGRLRTNTACGLFHHSGSGQPKRHS